MYESDRALANSDDVARARLSREFPDVSAHVVAALAAAYRRVTASPAADAKR